MRGNQVRFAGSNGRSSGARAPRRRSCVRPGTWRLACALFVAACAPLFFTRGASAVNRTWDGGGLTNNWSEDANWSGDTEPGAGDIAVFDGTSTKNATIDVNINVGAIYINPGYTGTPGVAGTITQAAGVAVTLTGGPLRVCTDPNSQNFFAFCQEGGTFVGGNSTLDFDGAFGLGAGTFTATSGTTFFGAGFTHKAGGTFNHNNGTAVFDGGGDNIGVGSGNPPTPAENFNNLTFNRNAATVSFLEGTLIVNGALVLDDGFLIASPFAASTVEARAGVTVGSGFDGGTAPLLITQGDGSPRTVTFNAGAKLLPLTLDAANVTVNTAGAGTLVWRNLTLRAGTINQGNVAFEFGQVGQSVGNYNQSGGAFNGSAQPITYGINGGSFTQSGGTFAGGSGNIDVGDATGGGVFTLSGGAFTASSNTTSFASDFTHTGGTFNHNGGAVVFDESGGSVNVTPPVAFNHLTCSKSNAADNASLFVAGTLIVNGTLALNDGFMLSGVGGGSLQARGAVVVGPNFNGGTLPLAFTGGADQTYTNNGGQNLTGAWTVNKTTGKVTLASNLVLANGQTLDITSGTLDQGASFNLQTSNTLTVGAGGALVNLGTGDLTLGGDLTNGGAVRLNGNGAACGGADSIQIRSTVAGTQRAWAGAGLFSLKDVDAQDQAGTAAITVFSGTDSGNNGANWSFNPNCPQLSINDVTAGEGNAGVTNFAFTVTLDAADTVPVTVDFAAADGTANAGSDYQATSGTLTFTPGGPLTQPVNVAVNGDGVFELNETFFVNLSNAAEADILDGQGQGTIQNDDPPPTISINDVSSSEGNAGTTSFTFTVTLSNQSSQAVAVNFQTANGTATVAGSDYATASGTVTFAPLDTSETVTVQVNGDALFESDETFLVNLSGSTGAAVADSQGQGTIQNDDSAPSISINDVTLAEGDAGQTAFTFNVTLSAASGLEASVNFATADGSAQAGSDYAVNSGTATFAPGETTMPVTVQVNGDTAFEPDETFLVNLSGASGATLSDAQGQGAITNDDAEPTPTPTPTPSPTPGAQPGPVLISEFRLSGVTADDEFIELYNNTDSDIDISGYRLEAAAGQSVTVPAGTLLRARSHYLVARLPAPAAGYTLSHYAAPDLTYDTFDLPAETGIVLLDAAGGAVDAAGTGAAPPPYREGAALPVVTAAGQHAFVRTLSSGLPADTGDNAADFTLVSTDPQATGAGALLGAPGPQNLSSPVQRNGPVKPALFDPCAPPGSAPNTVRDSSFSDPANNSTLGTFSIRRRFINMTGADVVRLRFRIVSTVALTAAGDPPAGTADLRALSTPPRPSVTIAGAGCAGEQQVSIESLTLEELAATGQPSQPRGGALNSTLAAGTITLAAPLGPGQSRNFEFLLGVEQTGFYRFFVNVEALPGPAGTAAQTKGGARRKAGQRQDSGRGVR